jgi:hypothetical protein
MPYDIFKKDAAGRIIWIETAKDLKSAKRLAKNLSRNNEWQFVVFDRRPQTHGQSSKNLSPSNLTRVYGDGSNCEFCDYPEKRESVQKKTDSGFFAAI